MKKLTFLFMLASALLLAASCAREPIPATPDDLSDIQKPQLSAEEIRALAEHYTPTRVSKEEAIATATDILKMLDEDNPVTKSGASRHIAGISVLRGNLPDENGLKSGMDEDTLAFAVSFGDGLGYAVLSADHRTDAILAVCPEGNPLSERDTTCGVCVFYDNLEGFLARQIEESKEREEKFLAEAMAKIAADTLRLRQEAEARGDTLEGDGTKCIYYSQWSSYGNWSLAGTLGPLVGVCWHQFYPCNMYCPVIDGQNTVAGCVAVAAAQIMSYWQKPTEYNWKEMKAYSNPNDWRISLVGQSEIGRLIHNVGVGCDMNYGVSGSGTDDAKVVNYFRNIGYQHPGVKGGYNNNRVINSLNSRIPLLAGGYKGFLGLGGGHEWVIDGYRNYRRTITVHVSWRFLWWGEDYSYSYDEYCQDVHCNMGWGGSQDNPGSNGYYNSGAFNTAAGNYNWWIDCIYDVVP